MSISSIATIQDTTSETAASSQGTLSKDEFLLLFVTQLQNQDPLSPMDNAEMASQTAQFASLEQLQNINQNLADLMKYQSAIFDENAVSLIGKTVKAFDNTVELPQSGSVEFQFDLEQDATAVYVSIYDAEGERVAEVSGNSLSEGTNTLSWDGTIYDGSTRATPGKYYIDIQAVDSSLATFAGVPFYEDVVKEVNFWDGVAYLTAGDRQISMTNVLTVTDSDE